MPHTITTPSGVTLTVTTDPNDTYLQDLPKRGYKVERRPRIHIGENACTACEG